MRVALVHDWLLGMRGGERCLECILEFFPDADIYTLFYDPENISEVIRERSVQASWLNRLPFVRSYYRHLLPLYAWGVQDLEAKLALGNYDLVVSISHCVAKNVRLPHGTFHLCYCLTPARYFWDQYEHYFSGKRLEPLLRPIVKRLREKDVAGAAGVNHFVGISEFVATRIKKFYQREADVVYPPVRTDWIEPRTDADKGIGFVCINALVPYKNVELVIDTFNEIGEQLTIVGSGPLESELRARAKGNIRFRKDLTNAELAACYREAKALVFAAEEDFGMIPVENLAAGRPVICYARGGVLETMSRSSEVPTAVFFSELTTASLAGAISHFIVRQDQFTVDNCLSQARKFSHERFRDDFSRVLRSCGLASDLTTQERVLKEQNH